MRAFPYPLLMACCLGAGLLSVGGCQPGGEQETMEEEPAAEEPSGMDDEAAIRALADAYTAGWANGDAAAVASLYAPEGDLVGVEGRVHKGRAAVQARLAEDFSGVFKGTQIAITTESIRFLNPTTAIVDGTFEISGITGADGAAAPPLKGLYSDLVMKEGGDWLLEAVRPMVPQAAPAPESD
jgi:uncharacterized protein (TIGR02246 family)